MNNPTFKDIQIAFAEKISLFCKQYFSVLKNFYQLEPKWKTNFPQEFVKYVEDSYKSIILDSLEYAKIIKKYCNENNIDIKNYKMLNSINESNGVIVNKLEHYKEIIDCLYMYMHLIKLVKNCYVENELIEKDYFNKLINQHYKEIDKIYEVFNHFYETLIQYKSNKFL